MNYMIMDAILHSGRRNGGRRGLRRQFQMLFTRYPLAIHSLLSAV